MTALSYRRAAADVDRVDLAALAATMRSFMAANICGDGIVVHHRGDDDVERTSLPGCVIASPSFPDAGGVTDQDYVHFWLRDGAVTAMELAASPTLDTHGVDRTLCDYVSFCGTCQDNAPRDSPTGFFRACYNIDGTPRNWSDQKDGPALQSLSFVDAWPYLDDPARQTATRVAQRNLEEIVAHWDEHDGDVKGPWEDRFGSSFFARAAQLRFLEEVATTNALGLDPPRDLAAAVQGLREALSSHWEPDPGGYRSVLGVDEYDPNADVIAACIYGSVPCTDTKLLRTAGLLREAFDVDGAACFPINVSDRARGLGPLIGRYPQDTYDGDISEPPNEGHPWALCTANFAQLYYCLATAVRRGEVVGWNDETSRFYAQVGLDQTTVDSPDSSASVVGALVEAGDRMLRAVVLHSDHNHLSEQFDKDTGYEKSVQDLTWSYAAYLSAVRERPA